MSIARAEFEVLQVCLCLRKNRSIEELRFKTRLIYVHSCEDTIASLARGGAAGSERACLSVLDQKDKQIDRGSYLQNKINLCPYLRRLDGFLGEGRGCRF